MSESKAQKQATPGGLSPLFLLAVLLPGIGYLASIGLAEAKRMGAPTIEVAITGYDPRDLVRGHYLSYQLALDETEATQEMERIAALKGDAVDDSSYRYSFSHACAIPSQNKLSRVVLFNADSPAECRHSLPISFVQEPHRFYIQQDHAQEIERAVGEKRATVVLRILSDGTVTADQLLIDGKVFGSR